MKKGKISQYGNQYNKLTDEERIWLGLKRPTPLKGTIRIVIPEHYSSRGMKWESRFVTAGSLSSWKEQYPNLQIVK